MDPGRRVCTVSDQTIKLSPREYELLLCLLHNSGRVLSRAQLLDKVWGYEYFGETRTVDVHIRHLREKIEIDPSNPRYLKVVWGLGYKIEKEAKQ